MEDQDGMQTSRVVNGRLIKPMRYTLVEQLRGKGDGNDQTRLLRSLWEREPVTQ